MLDDRLEGWMTEETIITCDLAIAEEAAGSRGITMPLRTHVKGRYKFGIDMEGHSPLQWSAISL